MRFMARVSDLMFCLLGGLFFLLLDLCCSNSLRAWYVLLFISCLFAFMFGFECIACVCMSLFFLQWLYEFRLNSALFTSHVFRILVWSDVALWFTYPFCTWDVFVMYF